MGDDPLPYDVAELVDRALREMVCPVCEEVAGGVGDGVLVLEIDAVVEVAADVVEFCPDFFLAVPGDLGPDPAIIESFAQGGQTDEIPG